MTETIRLAVVAGVLGCALIGGHLGGYVGAVAGLLVGFALLAAPWRGLPLWSWLARYLSRNRHIELTEPVTVVNDRSGGGIRYQDGVAVAAVQLLGRAHEPTFLTGSTATETSDTVDVGDLFPALRQSLGLRIESMSLVTAGARRQATGDYSRVYDTLIGIPPYAGQRETWLIIRVPAVPNADALQCRSTIGTATLACAQRIVMMLRLSGIRARVGTAADITELERRLSAVALEPSNRRWGSLRGNTGWQTSYAYRPADVGTEVLAQAWSLRADGIVQNITLFPSGKVSATVTIRTPQPPTAPPSVLLQPLPGEQPQALAATLCVPRPHIRGLRAGAPQRPLISAIGPSGVLLGKTADGHRMLLPLGNPGEQSKVHIAADDAIAKRIVIRTAAVGERITVHSTDPRWQTVRMPHIAVVDHPRPAPGTTVSVVDGTVVPALRPGTVISVSSAGTAAPSGADVVISQTGPATVEVVAAGRTYDVEVEFFRAENRYASTEPARLDAALEMVE